MSNTLNYAGDITARFDLDQVIGPDLYGAYYTFTGAAYDMAADVTVATVRPIPPAELNQRAIAAAKRFDAQKAAISHYAGAVT